MDVSRDRPLDEGGFLGLEVFDGSLEEWKSCQDVARVSATEEMTAEEMEEDLGENLEAPSEILVEHETKADEELIGCHSCEEALGDGDGLGTQENAWEQFGLSRRIQSCLLQQGFVKPTRIQESCLPAAIHECRDIIGAAETGSGKTLAFSLPIINGILTSWPEKEKRTKKMLALVLTPTRELAIQVHDMMKAIATPCGINIVPVVGGMAVQKQERLLKTRPEIVVATPGRLWALMEEGDEHLNDLSELAFLVVDEADRMVEKGHFQELQDILEKVPFVSTRDTSKSTEINGRDSRPELQTFVFSATLTLPAHLSGGGAKHKAKKKGKSKSPVQAIMKKIKFRSGWKVIDLTNEQITAQGLKECFCECTEKDRDAALYYLLAKHGGQTLIFCNAISAIRRLASILKLLGLPVGSLHASMQQRQRLKVLDRFTKKQISILVATDVAARGLDIEGVSIVIHYQVPKSLDAYVHRSGRTARASREGLSIVLVAPSERKEFLALCKGLDDRAMDPFPIDSKLMPEIHKRMKLVLQIDEVERAEASDKSRLSWFERNAEAIGIELDIEDVAKKKKGGDGRTNPEAKRAKLADLKGRLARLLAEPLEVSINTKFLSRDGAESKMTLQTVEKIQQGREAFAMATAEHQKRQKKNGKRKARIRNPSFVYGREDRDALEVAKRAKGM